MPSDSCNQYQSKNNVFGEETASQFSSSQNSVSSAALGSVDLSGKENDEIEEDEPLDQELGKVKILHIVAAICVRQFVSTIKRKLN